MFSRVEIIGLFYHTFMEHNMPASSSHYIFSLENLTHLVFLLLKMVYEGGMTSYLCTFTLQQVRVILIKSVVSFMYQLSLNR